MQNLMNYSNEGFFMIFTESEDLGNNTKLFAQDIATLNDATVYSVGATFIVTKNSEYRRNFNWIPKYIRSKIILNNTRWRSYFWRTILKWRNVFWFLTCILSTTSISILRTKCKLLFSERGRKILCINKPRTDLFYIYCAICGIEGWYRRSGMKYLEWII